MSISKDIFKKKAKKKISAHDVLMPPEEHENISENVPADKNASVDVSSDTREHVHVNVYENKNERENTRGTDDTNNSGAVDASEDAPVDNDAHGSVDVSHSVSGSVSDDRAVPVDFNALVHSKVDVKALSQQIKAKKQKESFEKNYTRRTLWIRNDLNELLDLERKNANKITAIVNNALQLYFNMKARGLIKDE